MKLSKWLHFDKDTSGNQEKHVLRDEQREIRQITSLHEIYRLPTGFLLDGYGINCMRGTVCHTAQEIANAQMHHESFVMNINEHKTL